jgi:hypothetical protein
MLAVGVWAAWGVHAAPGYAREDWRGLVEILSSRRTNGQQIWLSDVEAVLPLTFYQAETSEVSSGGEPPACTTPCWWVLRQPYTETHAFAQGVMDPDRPWKPEMAGGCQVTERWESPTGLALWEVTCGQPGAD